MARIISATSGQCEEVLASLPFAQWINMDILWQAQLEIHQGMVTVKDEIHIQIIPCWEAAPYTVVYMPQ